MRYIIFYSCWLIIVPWCAACLWLATDRLTSGQGYSIQASIEDGAFGALFGVIFAIRLTLPLCLLVFAALKVFPHIFERQTARIMLLVSLCGAGIGWTLYLVREAGFAGGFWATMLIGAFSGGFLTWVSLRTLLLRQ